MRMFCLAKMLSLSCASVTKYKIALLQTVCVPCLGWPSSTLCCCSKGPHINMVVTLEYIHVHQHARRHWFGLTSSGSFMSRRRSHPHNKDNDSFTTATAASPTRQLYSDSSNDMCCHSNHICHNYCTSNHRHRRSLCGYSTNILTAIWPSQMARQLCAGIVRHLLITCAPAISVIAINDEDVPSVSHCWIFHNDNRSYYYHVNDTSCSSTGLVCK